MAAALVALAVASPGASGAPDELMSGDSTGVLDLVSNDTDGDGFEYIPADPAEPTLRESVTASNQGKITESNSPDLANLGVTGGGSAGQLYPALKAHVWGVHGQGEGNGTPAVQINGSGAGGQTLTIAVGPDTPGGLAWYAQVGLKFKFGASAKLEALAADGTVVATDQKTCDGSDCGPDSGGDRLLLTVGNADDTTLFSAVRISIVSPEDGAVSVVDDPAAGFDTYLEISKYDGDIDCPGGTSGAPSAVSFGGGSASDPEVSVQRLQNLDGEPCVPKLWAGNVDAYNGTQALAEFIVNDLTQTAQYVFDLTFPVPASLYPPDIYVNYGGSDILLDLCAADGLYSTDATGPGFVMLDGTGTAVTLSSQVPGDLDLATPGLQYSCINVLTSASTGPGQMVATAQVWDIGDVSWFAR